MKYVLGALVDKHPADELGLSTDTVWVALYGAYEEEIGSDIEDIDWSEFTA